MLAGHVSKKALSGESAQQSPGYTPHGHTGEEKKRLTLLIQMQHRRESQNIENKKQ